MRVPQLFSLYLSGRVARYPQFLVICLSYIVVSLVLVTLAFTHHFGGILVLSLIIAAILGMTRPIIFGFISQLVDTRHNAEITGVQEMVTR